MHRIDHHRVVVRLTTLGREHLAIFVGQVVRRSILELELQRRSDRLLAMLEGGPREDSRMGLEACTLLEEIVAINWSAGKNVQAVHVNANRWILANGHGRV